MSQGREAILIMNLFAMRLSNRRQSRFRLRTQGEPGSRNNSDREPLRDGLKSRRRQSRFRLRARGAPRSRSDSDSVHIQIFLEKTQCENLPRRTKSCVCY